MTLDVHTLFRSAETNCSSDSAGVVELTLTRARPEISPDVLCGIERALEVAEGTRSALVIASDAEHFALGANLDAPLAAANEGRIDVLDAALAHYQRTMLRLRHASVPTVAAVRGVAVSGGCELVMHCTHVVAAPRCAVGLAEPRLGLVPGGGGLKELALRASRKAGELAAHIEAAFDTVVAGRLAIGAQEALELGFFEEEHTDVASDATAAARRVGLELRARHSSPPRNPSMRVAGMEVAGRLVEKQRRAYDDGRISAHQLAVNTCVAYVICGGEGATCERDESWMLALEREKFLELAPLPLTQARLAHLRATGKVLEN